MKLFFTDWSTIVVPVNKITCGLFVNAPWYVSNQLLHNDLHIPSITEEIQRAATKYNMKTYNHANDLIEHLYNNGPIDRRLRRTWPADLLQHRNDIP